MEMIRYTKKQIDKNLLAYLAISNVEEWLGTIDRKMEGAKNEIGKAISYIWNNQDEDAVAHLVRAKEFLK